MTTATEKTIRSRRTVKSRALADCRLFPPPFRTAGAELDIGIVGVPWDGGTTNRAGTRHGPRELRNASSFGASDPPDYPPFSL